ncbi:mycofactocin-coupled SDR family oxidoreductase [Cryptosporangium aurantiacum]|uniref:SDR family mycofactocin-dependent oxidoreductase n=1 Tax=Cryptosporangium aurantiacum TaxID=134849 RepID=A0A1M7R4R2_9ACTN|nr:mycofactocin-coupled SDR family oxidoreductase [Cryptosporangium aurantiacum]SHN39857.1 SDR family mycofactocin-dependent oxidoreductase [Cryptosporangium aurantiacum]
MGRIDGQVVWVTGAGRGQGRSHAVRLAEEGADVLVTDVCAPISPALPYQLATPEDLEETAELVRATGRRCLARRADVRDVDALRAAVADAVAELGNLNTVVANAGVISSGRAWELTEEAWNIVIGVNLTGVWNTARAAIPGMLAAGNGGSIVLISSAGGLRGHVPYAHYVASKHGVVGLARALSNELAEHGIRVNSVHPTGVSDTGLALNSSLEELAATHPLFGMGATNTLAPAVTPRDVSNAVLFLASDEGRYVTGLQMTVDAGSTTKP